MIELPEAHTLAHQLTVACAGRTVTFVEAAHTQHGFAFYHDDPVAYPAILGGKTVNGVQAFGGRIEMCIGDAQLVFNDGARLHHLTADAKRPDKHQLLMEFDDGTGLYCTVQMYAGIIAHFVGEPMGMYADVAHEKPSPLTDAFDRDYFESLFDGIKPSLSAKALLATEQRIPGLGNGVLQDILWHARIHPKAKALALTGDQRDELYRSVKDTLRTMTDQNGRDTEKDLYGNPGGYKTILSSKTLAWPCRRCGSGITRQAYLGGNVYFCAKCQALSN